MRPQPHLRVVVASDTEHDAENAAATRQIRLLLGVLLLAALVVSQFWFVPAVRSLVKPELQPELVGAAGAKTCGGLK